ncbi:hypothetical protein [Xanthomonas hortorum]|uniref:Uncharacterized protein n=1 Tax=Xanthomonas hortorum pv. hederae TaxID=453603 RepID=A0A9X4BVH4_9XANT|nr:hypothetical protein [Xanthomonas hortorum]MCE4369710.1 hypothetical protein [Xanthomonas hortorum pv. hederae]MDC8640223.1 hypothetical protein [Xanthomonas hortorum pv. hederae]PPU86248.1 hypothetical protein XhhCFBP4925_00515 [Xanthomonas hortorum pv. hederae]PUF01375.1 hypothetical protein C7T87_03385 [Xanthomonas hortorum pv. hederae]
MNILNPLVPAPAPVPTVLGQAPARIPTGGKIRAGIMVMTSRAAAMPKVRELYEQGVAAGQSFDQIERAIRAAVPELKHPLVPRNVPWFTVRAQDFPNPETARQILETYGQDRGEGVKLYRFPVVFPSDQWQVVMPHELAAWGANEKRFWSEYGADGRTRLCMCHAPVPMAPSGKRALRMFGGRKTMPRPDNGGRCDPEACAEYQSRQCNLSGRFLFFIPGIRSISAFELHTNSFYAMNAAIQKLETIAFLRGGRISGFLDRDRTPFYLSKRLMEVAHIDEQGQAVRVPQWIIELEAPVDVTALLREGEDDAVLAQAEVATQLLSGVAPPTDAIAPTAAAADDERPAPAPRPATRTPAASEGAGLPDHASVVAKAQAYGIDAERFEAYARRRWGAGWMVNPRGRRRVWDELDRYSNDPEGYADKVETELARVG